MIASIRQPTLCGSKPLEIYFRKFLQKSELNIKGEIKTPSGFDPDSNMQRGVSGP